MLQLDTSSALAASLITDKPFAGPVEVDETYFGGSIDRGNKHANNKQRLGRGGVGKARGRQG